MKSNSNALVLSTRAKAKKNYKINEPQSRDSNRDREQQCQNCQLLIFKGLLWEFWDFSRVFWGMIGVPGCYVSIGSLA